jgi:hypothetical protein
MSEQRPPLNVPKTLREAFTGSGTESFGFALADMVDREFNLDAETEYAACLKEAFRLVRRAAVLRWGRE